MFESLEPPFDPEDLCPEELDAWLGLDESDDGCGYGAAPDADLEQVAAEAVDDLERAHAGDLLDDLDAEATLARAGGIKQAQRAVQAELLRVAVHWADLHAVLSNPGATGKGRERLVRLGGDGTPEVAEFASAELGAVLGMSQTTVTALVADGLDLRHRFPLLWQQVQAGGVEVWLARKTAAETRPLSRAAAARVDAKIAGIAGTLTWPRLRDIVKAAMAAADPRKALSDAERAAEQAGVFLEPGIRHGYQSIIINAAAGDVHDFDQAIDVIARAMRILGDTRPHQRRRAAAAGILAHPQAALDLIAHAEAVRTAHADPTTGSTGDVTPAEQAEQAEPAEQAEQTVPGPTCSGSWKPFAFNNAVLYYHLSRETLDAIVAGEPFAGAGVVRVEDIGPVIADQVKQWLQHSQVTVKPVIDLAGIQPVDRYEVSPAMSEAIGLINPADSFPYSTCLSRHQDNDHTQPYLPMNRGGPPGQTHPALMAKMTRRSHRLKTFGGWMVRQIRPGARLFRSPHHYYFLVDQHGTTPLGKL